jgi:hygromycin-B 4-O-kinase
MPTAASTDAVRSFLEVHLGPGLELVADLPQGEWSRAFAFRHRRRDRVVRFNPLRASFDLDLVAPRFASAGLPIPAVIEIGEVDGGWFAISERVDGEFLEDLSPAGMEAALPAVLDMLEALRAADTSESIGFGPWDASGQGTYTSWREYLIDVECGVPAELRGGWQDVVAGTALGQSAFDAAVAEVVRLAPGCPGHRHVVHSDLLNRNVFTSTGRVTGVIDWQCAMFGDHLYDLAWFTFWAPWHPGVASIDWRRRALDRFRSTGADLNDADARLRCYEAHIGLRHLIYNAGRDRADLDAAARRTLEVLR